MTTTLVGGLECMADPFHNTDKLRSGGGGAARLNMPSYCSSDDVTTTHGGGGGGESCTKLSQHSSSSSRPWEAALSSSNNGAAARDISTTANVGLGPRHMVASGASLLRQDSGLSYKSYDDHNVTDNDTVLMEEKRKKANGDGYTVHRYLRGKLLGKGGFAKVYLCTAMDTNKQYAVKIVPKANLVKARARQKLQAEIKIHRTLKHRYICEYKHFFEDRNNCYILLELCHNQSMNEMIKRRKRLTEPEAAYFLSQLLEAVEYMHDACVIHRDLKLGNLFLDRNMHVKVGDLGLATRLEDKEEKRKTICGTPNYIAPEVIQGDKATRGHSFEVDIWSMGVILYTILVGKPPYEAKDVKATYQRILANEYKFPSHVLLSEQVQDLISNMLQSNPQDRPSLQEIASHAFLSENAIPISLPSSVLSAPPKWHVLDDGEIVVDDGMLSRIQHQQHHRNSGSTKTTVPPRQGASSSSLRLPLSNHDPNMAKSSSKLSSVGMPGLSSKMSSVSSIPSEKSTNIDMQRIVRSAALTMNNNNNNNNNRVGTRSTTGLVTATAKSYTPSPAFRIFEERSASRGRSATHERTVATVAVPSKERSVSRGRPTPTKARARTPSRLADDDDDLVSRTRSMSLAGGSYQPGRSPAVSLASTTVNAKSPHHRLGESEGDVFQDMLDRVETVLEITETRRGSYRPMTPRAVSPRGTTHLQWVTRYVDYTSKYGLGFLMNDGSSGVYFNDSTKTVSDRDGTSFQYVERRKAEDNKNVELLVETYSLTLYPDSLKKKVTLLKHFRNYLLEQQKKAVADGENDGWLSQAATTTTGVAAHPMMVYVKKWIRTKHAILFRLSNQTVQVVFYDQTEILLTPDERFLTYVDKNRQRQTFHFTDELVGGSAELEKRLKYTKEIMSQLLTTATTTASSTTTPTTPSSAARR